MLITGSLTSKQKKIEWQLPWLIAAVLVLVLLFLIGLGWWRSSGVGPQVQVPMFYDAHYLFPRAWTQEQTAPGVPDPAPLAFFGPNRVSQSFVSGSDRLSMVEVWLAGQEDEVVSVSLVDDQGGNVSGAIQLIAGPEGGSYHLSFEPFLKAKGRQFTLTMTAPDSILENPVVVRTVGGDRLDGSLNLNEYNRPGNLGLTTYASGLPGTWWLEAIGEQLLPAVFRIRLQQYKPSMFKGNFFPLLLLITALLTVLYLVLARPQAIPSFNQLSKALGWALVLVLTLFILWQLVGGRVKVRPFQKSIPLRPSVTVVGKAPRPGSSPRLINDLVADLWTAERYPEERFVSSEIAKGMPAIRVPADSRLAYNLDLPPSARFRTGIVGIGQGKLGIEVSVGEEKVVVEEVEGTGDANVQDVRWIGFDLTPWAGQPITINMITESKGDDLEGLWIMPQIETKSDWLLSDPLLPGIKIEDASYQFGDAVELIGFSVMPTVLERDDTAFVSLYWRPLLESDAYGKVFIHLIDEQGHLVAQDDTQPVDNAYPIPVWQLGTIILDEHALELPAELLSGKYTVAIGLYDPDSLARWSATGPDGLVIPDGRVILRTNVEVAP